MFGSLFALAVGGLFATTGAPNLAGHWVMKANGQPVFALSISGRGKNQKVVMTGPSSLEISGGMITAMAYPLVETHGGACQSDEEKRCHVVMTRQGRPDRDLYLSLDGEDRLNLLPVKSETMTTFQFARVEHPVRPVEWTGGPLALPRHALPPTNCAKVEPPRNAAGDNQEVIDLFDADQSERRALRQASAEEMQDAAKALFLADIKRRTRTTVLLRCGALTTAADYYGAAFIFQHGDHPDDYLRAHALAMAAMKLGHPKASWIAAATLDRYLLNIGKPQIFATQFSGSPGDDGRFVYDLDILDAELVGDAVRVELGARTLEQAKAQAREMNE